MTTPDTLDKTYPEVPLYARALFEQAVQDMHGWNNSFFVRSIDGRYLSSKANYAYLGWLAAANSLGSSTDIKEQNYE